MDKESLLRRMEESAGLTVCRAGSASLARLAVEAVRAGRHAVIAVRSRDALAVMRGLTTLFTSELSVGRAGASESSARGQAERPLWERPWVFLPPFSQRSLSREGWAERLSVLYALRSGTAKGVVFTADNLIPALPAAGFSGQSRHDRAARGGYCSRASHGTARGMGLSARAHGGARGRHGAARRYSGRAASGL